MSLVEKNVISPVGRLRLIASDTALVGIYFEHHRGAPEIDACAVSSHPILDRSERELGEYFRRERRHFEVPTALQGTDLQRRVWAALAALPFGARVSYGELAARIGRPRAIRAVASANARNPISIVIPCHRVIAKDGTLAGYAGGLDAKRWLLDHEAFDDAVSRDRSLALAM